MVPKVSVVMPVFNVERYIADAVRSVLAQTFHDYELLVIDDCSPDQSIRICQEFPDQRLRIIRHRENRGLAGARNTGIRQATGEYLAFLDSDDIWHPQKLALHVTHLDQNPEVGISFSRSQFMLPNGELTTYYQMPKLREIDSAYCLCRNPVGNGSAPVIRRETLQTICYRDARYGEEEDRYFDEDLRQSEDIECWIRILLSSSYRIEGIPEALTYYRLKAGGLSAQLYRQFASWETMLEKTRQRAPQLVATWGATARAYQLRYLSRQAIRLKDGKAAVHFVNRALTTYWPILMAEPGRTVSTLAASYLLRILPTTLYRAVEHSAHTIIGGMQGRSIANEVAQSAL